MATVLRHRKRADGSFRLVIHLDETKLLDGSPDPAYVRRFEWAPKPDGITQAEYVAMQLREATALIAAEATAGEGTKLLTEGTTV